MLITVGVYSIIRFEVTPATVIAVLTILGYSIYDGIVVFDKVDENTRLVSSTGGLTYSDMVNLSLNQVLMRSLNTSITALLPVVSLLVVGSWILGAVMLEEFALALLIGLLSGAYSSIFIASPLLAVLKEREPRYRDIKRRIDARGGDAEVVAATVATGRPPSARAAAATPARARRRPATGTADEAAPTVARRRAGPSRRAPARRPAAPGAEPRRRAPGPHDERPVTSRHDARSDVAGRATSATSPTSRSRASSSRTSRRCWPTSTRSASPSTPSPTTPPG